MSDNILHQEHSSTVTTNTSIEEQSEKLAWAIAEAADDRKAADIVLLNVEHVSYLTDYFVIATGFSKTQVRAISDAVQEKLEQQWEKHPLRITGQNEGTWVVQDYGQVIVHIMLPQEREYYNLEAFWGHAERIEFSPSDAE
ncbi:MAG: ribosome silencing factor [Cyanobacteriota bacterium]